MLNGLLLLSDAILSNDKNFSVKFKSLAAIISLFSLSLNTSIILLFMKKDKSSFIWLMLKLVSSFSVDLLAILVDIPFFSLSSIVIPFLLMLLLVSK